MNRSFMISSFLSTLLDFGFWSGFCWGLFLSGLLGELGLVNLLGFLGLHLLDVSISDLFFGSFDVLVSGGVIFLLSSSDFVKGHTYNSLLNSGGSSGSLLLDVFNLNFLVESSGCLGPSKLDGLDFLVEKTSSLG